MMKWNSGDVPYSSLPHVLDLICEPRPHDFLELPDELWEYYPLFGGEGDQPTQFYAKGLHKCHTLESVFKRPFTNLDDINCPESINLLISSIRKDPTKIYACTSYPTEHDQVLQRCAQKNALLYGQWLDLLKRDHDNYNTFGFQFEF